MSGSRLNLTSTSRGVRFDLRVSPRASRTSVDGVRDGRLVVRVTAPPVDGEANDAVIRALAAALNLPRSAVQIVGGASGRNKTVEVLGMQTTEIGRRLGVEA
jgi:uncharacterized protein